MLSRLIPLSDECVFFTTYVAVLAAYAMMNRAEFKRCPEKGMRYRALPFGYKVLCWFFVIPMFAGTLIVSWVAIPALVCFMLLESACIRWYRKSGLIR